MKIQLLFVGKTKNPNLIALLRVYQKRIDHFCDFALTAIRSAEGHDAATAMDREGGMLLARIRPDAFVVALDLDGKKLTSEEFASLIGDRRDHTLKDLVFVIGSHAGLSEKVKRRSNRTLSLSAMTLNHEIAQLVLVEQIYRAFTLIHHIPYHK